MGLAMGIGTTKHWRSWADTIAPAELEYETMIAAEKGEAATIIEQGHSQVEGLQELVGTLKRSGDDAKRLFIIRKLGLTPHHAERHHAAHKSGRGEPDRGR